jgi:hypothetical protein
MTSATTPELIAAVVMFFGVLALAAYAIKVLQSKPARIVAVIVAITSLVGGMGQLFRIILAGQSTSTAVTTVSPTESGPPTKSVGKPAVRSSAPAVPAPRSSASATPTSLPSLPVGGK